MKKSLLSKVDALLEGMIGRIENLEKVAVDQFPVICQEIVLERKIELENSMIVAGISLFLSLLGMTVCLAIGLNLSSDNTETIKGIAYALAFSAIIPAWITGTQFLEALLEIRRLKATPKLYVLRELRSIISSQ